ncbi:MAG: GNAT family acetyltransferase [Anaerolineae bacterium]
MSQVTGTPPGLRIRPFEMAEYDSVLALWQASAPGIEIRPSDSRAEVEKRCRRDQDLFLVAEREGRIVGVVMGGWDGRRGWIHHLAVAADAQGQGVASALVDQLEDRLRALGCLKVNLLVRRGNEAARSLYMRMGYQEAPSLVAMGKELPSQGKN